MRRRFAAKRALVLGLHSRIRQARELVGLSRSDLARRIGVGPSAAIQWENPQGTAPNVRHLIAIAEITDVSFEWLATGRGPARLGTGSEIPAVDPECFAHDLFEEEMLRVARQVPMRHRDALLRYLQLLYPPARNKRS
jgi:transcriptional regulator with XRE-family HTH domain